MWKQRYRKISLIQQCFAPIDVRFNVECISVRNAFYLYIFIFFCFSSFSPFPQSTILGWILHKHLPYLWFSFPIFGGAMSHSSSHSLFTIHHSHIQKGVVGKRECTNKKQSFLYMVGFYHVDFWCGQTPRSLPVQSSHSVPFLLAHSQWINRPTACTPRIVKIDTSQMAYCAISVGNLFKYSVCLTVCSELQSIILAAGCAACWLFRFFTFSPFLYL